MWARGGGGVSPSNRSGGAGGGGPHGQVRGGPTNLRSKLSATSKWVLPTDEALGGGGGGSAGFRSFEGHGLDRGCVTTSSWL
jgi:hypothetical protein